MLFPDVIAEIVATDGPNAITRANILKVLGAMDTFDAHGWLAPKPVRAWAAAGWS